MDNFGALIAVESGRLPLYAVEKNIEAKTVTCWIPATAGQAFTVNWTRHSKDVEWTSCCDVFLDGIGLGGTALRPGPPGTPFRNVNRKSVISTGKGGEPLLFGECSAAITSPDDPSKKEEGGEVRLEIHRIEDITRAYVENHNITYIIPGEPEPSLQKPGTLGAQWKYGPGANLNRIERIVTFIFKYRELDILNASGLTTERYSSRRRRRPSVSMPPSAVETQDGVIIKVEEGMSAVSLETNDSRELEGSRKRKRPDHIATVENGEEVSSASSTAVGSQAGIAPNAEEQACIEHLRPIKRSRKRKPADPMVAEAMMAEAEYEYSDGEIWKEIKHMRACLDQLMAKAHFRKTKTKPNHVKTPAKPPPGYLTRAVVANIAEQAAMAVGAQMSGVESEPPKMVEDAIVMDEPVSKLRAWN